MAHELETASTASVVSLLGALINEAKGLLVQELSLAQLEARQAWRTTKRAAFALGSGAGLAVTGGLLLLVMLTSLLAAWTELPLWGSYGLIGGAFALLGGVLLARGTAPSAALDSVPPQTAETLNGKVPRRAEQPTAERQAGLSSSLLPARAGQSRGRAAALNPKAFWELLKVTFTRWSAEKPFQLAAALAYYTLFSLAPLLIIVIAIAGLVFGHEAAQNHIVSTLQGVVGPEGAQAIQALIQQASQPSAGILAILMGTVTLLIGAGGVVGQLQDSLNTIWGVEPKPGRGLLGLVRDRFVSFGMVLGIGFLLLVSLVVSAGLAAVIQVLGGVLPGGEALWHGLEVLVSFGLITVLFALIYKVLPDVHLAWRDVWIGAAVTSLLFTLGKLLLGLYLGRKGVTSAYGAASSLVLILLWVYYSALIVFFGAEFTRVYASVYGAGVAPTDNAQPLSAGTRPQPGSVDPAGDTALPTTRDSGLRHAHE